MALKALFKRFIISTVYQVLNEQPLNPKNTFKGIILINKNAGLSIGFGL